MINSVILRFEIVTITTSIMLIIVNNYDEELNVNNYEIISIHLPRNVTIMKNKSDKKIKMKSQYSVLPLLKLKLFLNGIYGFSL